MIDFRGIPITLKESLLLLHNSSCRFHLTLPLRGCALSFSVVVGVFTRSEYQQLYQLLGQRVSIFKLWFLSVGRPRLMGLEDHLARLQG